MSRWRGDDDQDQDDDDDDKDDDDDEKVVDCGFFVMMMLMMKVKMMKEMEIKMELICNYNDNWSVILPVLDQYLTLLAIADWPMDGQTETEAHWDARTHLQISSH